MVKDSETKDIFDEIREQSALAERLAMRALIIQPGAVGDCVLTLPLVRFLKDALGLGGVDLLAHADYVGFYPGRTGVDSIRSIDTVDLHRLFVRSADYQVQDQDPLVTAFMDYALIVSFLGTQDSDFEANLVYTVHCSRSADVVILPLKPPRDTGRHVASYYCEQLTDQCALLQDRRHLPGLDQILIQARDEDEAQGRTLLRESGLEASRPLVIMHPGSGGLDKCWYLDNYLALAGHMKTRGWSVVFVLGPVEEHRMPARIRDRVERVAPVLSGLTLDQVVGLLSCAQAFVGNDSGVSHVAGAMGVRTCTVFGPTSPQVYGPMGPSVHVFTASPQGFSEKAHPEVQGRILEVLLDGHDGRGKGRS